MEGLKGAVDALGWWAARVARERRSRALGPDGLPPVRRVPKKRRRPKKRRGPYKKKGAAA